MLLYLGDEVWVKMTSLVYDFFQDLLGCQRDMARFLFHKMQERLHFLTSKVQHRIQVINHTVFRHTQTDTTL